VTRPSVVDGVTFAPGAGPAWFRVYLFGDLIGVVGRAPRRQGWHAYTSTTGPGGATRVGTVYRFRAQAANALVDQVGP
jgi:hypothetical protein